MRANRLSPLKVFHFSVLPRDVLQYGKIVPSRVRAQRREYRIQNTEYRIHFGTKAQSSTRKQQEGGSLMRAVIDFSPVMLQSLTTPKGYQYVCSMQYTGHSMPVNETEKFERMIIIIIFSRFSTLVHLQSAVHAYPLCDGKFRDTQESPCTLSI